MRPALRRDASLPPQRLSQSHGDDLPTEQLLVRGLSSEPSSSHASEPSSEPRSGVVRKSRGERLAEPERLGLVGSVIDARYRIDAVLGEGGSGLVFAATRLADHAQVALKVLHARHAGNAVFVRAFEREAAIASQLRVDGVVRCLDRGLLADGSPYAIFERVDGIGLSRLAKRLGGLRQREAIAIVMRVAETLETLHRHGVVHRDIKPEHIVVRAGERGQLEVSLLDLGTCVTLDARDEIARDSGGVAVQFKHGGCGGHAHENFSLSQAGSWSGSGRDGTGKRTPESILIIRIISYVTRAELDWDYPPLFHLTFVKGFNWMSFLYKRAELACGPVLGQMLLFLRPEMKARLHRSV